ncbi:RNaseH domain-containing protein [Streptomyces platensis]|uniref:RNaseH domain-containing protein n=1 Tax=Streptomyces platensis TaxID=58346 RepID=UPI003F63CBCE
MLQGSVEGNVLTPGLHNNKQGLSPDPDDPRLWLPGSGLPASWNPVSIIRMNCAQAEMPRLVSVIEKLKNGATKPLKTSSDLYYPEDRPRGASVVPVHRAPQLRQEAPRTVEDPLACRPGQGVKER